MSQYRFYGEPVVRACVKAGTSHVDISGEPFVGPSPSSSVTPRLISIAVPGEDAAELCGGRGAERYGLMSLYRKGQGKGC